MAPKKRLEMPEICKHLDPATDSMYYEKQCDLWKAGPHYMRMIQKTHRINSQGV